MLFSSGWCSVSYCPLPFYITYYARFLPFTLLALYCLLTKKILLVKRRQFIKLSALSAGAFSIPFLHGCNSTSFNKAVAQPLFLSRIFDAKTMQATGLAYIKQKPAEDSKSKLAYLLADNSINETTDAKTVHTFYDNKVKDDFTSLKTVIVNGWVLAVTEARQCALYSLTQS